MANPNFNVNKSRDLVQTVLLSKLFATSMQREIVLKGGMAMRTGTGTRRLTKDIDLMSSPEIPVERIRKNIRDALKRFQETRILKNVVISEPKQTDTTLRWKIGGRYKGAMINLTLEISRREPMPEGHVKQVEWTPPELYGVPPVMVDMLDLSALCMTKMNCMMDDRREAPRDVYDLWVLFRMDIRPPEEAMSKANAEALKKGLQNTWAKLEKMSYEVAKKELLPFLEDDIVSQIDEEFWEDMKALVGIKMDEFVPANVDNEGESKGLTL